MNARPVKLPASTGIKPPAGSFRQRVPSFDDTMPCSYSFDHFTVPDSDADRDLARREKQEVAAQSDASRARPTSTTARSVSPRPRRSSKPGPRSEPPPRPSSTRPRRSTCTWAPRRSRSPPRPPRPAPARWPARWGCPEWPVRSSAASGGSVAGDAPSIGMRLPRSERCPPEELSAHGGAGPGRDARRAHRRLPRPGHPVGPRRRRGRTPAPVRRPRGGGASAGGVPARPPGRPLVAGSLAPPCMMGVAFST